MPWATSRSLAPDPMSRQCQAPRPCVCPPLCLNSMEKKRSLCLDTEPASEDSDEASLEDVCESAPMPSPRCDAMPMQMCQVMDGKSTRRLRRKTSCSTAQNARQSVHGCGGTFVWRHLQKVCMQLQCWPHGARAWLRIRPSPNAEI